MAVQGGEPSVLRIGELFAVEVLGGVALGLIAGYACYRAMHRLDELNLQVLVTLAVVMVSYAAAIRLDASGVNRRRRRIVAAFSPRPVESFNTNEYRICIYI